MDDSKELLRKGTIVVHTSFWNSIKPESQSVSLLGKSTRDYQVQSSSRVSSSSFNIERLEVFILLSTVHTPKAMTKLDMNPVVQPKQRFVKIEAKDLNLNLWMQLQEPKELFQTSFWPYSRRMKCSQNRGRDLDGLYCFPPSLDSPDYISLPAQADRITVNHRNLTSNRMLRGLKDSPSLCIIGWHQVLLTSST